MFGFTNGGRPRRLAAIAGAIRIKEAHQQYPDEAHEDYNLPANEKEAEGTIVCRLEPAGFGTAKANVAPESDDENDELIASPDEIDEIDDENDEDFEIDREDTEEEDDGVMDGDEGISEIEEMGHKEKKRTIARKKGLPREKKRGKNSLQKKNAPPARGVVGFRVTKVSQKVCINIKPKLWMPKLTG